MLVITVSRVRIPRALTIFQSGPQENPSPFQPHRRQIRWLAELVVKDGPDNDKIQHIRQRQIQHIRLLRHTLADRTLGTFLFETERGPKHRIGFFRRCF